MKPTSMRLLVSINGATGLRARLLFLISGYRKLKRRATIVTSRPYTLPEFYYGNSRKRIDLRFNNGRND